MAPLQCQRLNLSTPMVGACWFVLIWLIVGKPRKMLGDNNAFIGVQPWQDFGYLIAAQMLQNLADKKGARTTSSRPSCTRTDIFFLNVEELKTQVP